MIIECSLEGGIRLIEPLDFRRFKLVLKGEASVDQPWQGITFVDDRNALVPIQLVPTLNGRPDDSTWEQSFAEMVTKAREHGWIEAETDAIRAHVERQP
ncbi:hypothetical protein CQ12_32525 [Bradyrhizobium jicamae]|uniref:Uncharacterized protein n=1 Tax=Bradyrhizobium jicamae TaxID=280332 RepID=A0A0R3M7N4_9BRAD|nr:hypothetical protein [Bradyrhizobium jicamae]KRR15868.1 hypothetical protein CQ12_32525 [Bradyrhizobium jicamae]